MKKIILILFLGCLFTASVVFGSEHDVFEGLKVPDYITSAVDIADLETGTPVTLVGRIEAPMGSTLHKFVDASGMTVLSIDYVYDDLLNSFSVNDILEVKGSVARDFDKTYVNVDGITKFKN